MRSGRREVGENGKRGKEEKRAMRKGEKRVRGEKGKGERLR